MYLSLGRRLTTFVDPGRDSELLVILFDGAQGPFGRRGCSFLSEVCPPSLTGKEDFTVEKEEESRGQGRRRVVSVGRGGLTRGVKVRWDSIKSGHPFH